MTLICLIEQMIRIVRRIFHKEKAKKKEVMLDQIYLAFEMLLNYCMKRTFFGKKSNFVITLSFGFTTNAFYPPTYYVLQHGN